MVRMRELSLRSSPLGQAMQRALPRRSELANRVYEVSRNQRQMFQQELATLLEREVSTTLGYEGMERLRTRSFFRTAPTSARDRSINSIGTNYLIKLTIQLGGVVMKALLDLGAQGNYVSCTAVERAGLMLRYKTNPYPLRVANGELMPGEENVTLEVRGAPLQLQDHKETLDLDILRTAAHDVILGLP
jgi:hypothetical protein